VKVVNYPNQQIGEVHQRYRSDGFVHPDHPWYGKYVRGVGETTIAQYREMGMLDGLEPGSWEETTVVRLMENQRLIQEC
jgi:hypothetical protein